MGRLFVSSTREGQGDPTSKARRRAIDGISGKRSLEFTRQMLKRHWRETFRLDVEVVVTDLSRTPAKRISSLTIRRSTVSHVLAVGRDRGTAL